MKSEVAFGNFHRMVLIQILVMINTNGVVSLGKNILS